MILHWDGHSWSLQPSPAGELAGVSAISASDAWAVGYDTNSSNQLQALALHWDGQVWSAQASPNPPSGYSQLNAVSAAPAPGVWAAGRTGDGNFAARYC